MDKGDVEIREKSVLELDREKKQLFKSRLKQLADCDEVVSAETVNAIGRVTKDVRAADDNAPSSDELDEELEDEYRDLNQDLSLPDDTYSLTEIKPELPACVRYGVRSGLTHINMPKFSPLSRGHQGGATAIAAFATTTLYKSRCWNEAVIDQIIDDGDTFYCESYKSINTDDRRLLSILDLKRELSIQGKLNVNVSIEDPAYAGKFRSTEPTELHLVKALDLFFKRHDAGILSSSVLNIAIWKDAKYYNIFDGQARKESCEPAPDGISGTAKLFLVKDIIGVLFIILEKSNVKNEPFVIYAIAISGVEQFSLTDHPDEPETALGKPQRRPSGYIVQEKYRAVVQGTYHLMHPVIPEILRGKGHLIIALAALVYSRLVNANKWTTALIDLIFNQAHIYMIDLVRVIEKRFDDEEFELRLDDLMGDMILGAYSAKVKIRPNMIPGHGQKKGKLSIDAGIREFFETQVAGILEVKKFFYAIWKENDTYYFMDPFACDDEGYRINFSEIERVGKPYREAACVTMNSSINQIMETVLENTGNKDRDPFVIHGLKVLYVKTGTTPGGPLEMVIYRERGTSRRPQAPALSIALADTPDKGVDMTPRIRPEMDKIRDAGIQVPTLMKDVDTYMKKDNEPLTYIVLPEEETIAKKPVVEEEEEEEETDVEALTEDTEETEDDRRPYETVDVEKTEEKVVEEKPIIKNIYGYKVINPHRLVLQGSQNCLDEKYDPKTRGRQGLICALTAIAYRRLKHPARWRSIDIDQILDVSTKTHEDVIDWIKQGRPVIKDTKDELPGEGEEEEEEEEEAEEEEDETKKLIPAPSHLDLTMLPVRLKLAEDDVFYKTKMNIINGEANPLVNLAEALECYFKRYSELILENKKLLYGIWRQDSKFFVFNPYGSDEEGWRLRNHPASFAVADSLNELVDLLYGILEFNDPSFTIHFVALDSIQPGKFTVDEDIIIPTDATIEKFRTRFLPITDDDLLMFEVEEKTEEDEDTEQLLLEEKEDVEEEEEEEEDEDEEEDEEYEKRRLARLKAYEDAEARLLVDKLLEVKEQDQPDAPPRLNLILLTSNMRIYEEDSGEVERLHDEAVMEKMKYSFPPPYVMPSNKTLLKLLEAKRARRSVHSLVSRFSIDSRLEVKKKGGFSPMYLTSRMTLIMPSAATETKPSKMIKLSPKKYLYSRVLPICLMPLRAINDIYIHHEDIVDIYEEEVQRKLKREKEGLVPGDIPDIPVDVRIRPELIPLGPTIKTPIITRKPVTCFEKKKRKCLLTKGDEGDALMEKVLCNTEELLLELFFPDFKARDELQQEEKENDVKTKNSIDEKVDIEVTTVRGKDSSEKKKSLISRESVGFKVIDDGYRIIQGNLCLRNREKVEACHIKSCFFSAMLCILAKIAQDPETFRGSLLDQFIFLGDKIYCRTGKLRYKPYRWFHRIEILDTIYNVVTKQEIYADPESCPVDDLETTMNTFLEKNKTGILVFGNCSYAFWKTNDKYYLFDSYGCDEKGNANEEGYSCLLEFRDLDSMLEKIKQNIGENVGKPYRVYAISIAHMETKKRRRKRRKKQIHCEEKKEYEEVSVEEPAEVESSVESEVSLIELSDWVNLESKPSMIYDTTIPGFAPIRHYDASVLNVVVLENEITDPILTPFKKLPTTQKVDLDDYDAHKFLVRRKIYDRTFQAHTAIATPLDLCIMAWSLIHDPIIWSVRTIRGLFDASIDYAFDSILATEDSTVSNLTDGLLPEFEIANYIFRVVFAPIHYGILYASEGWNLSMSLQRVFETPSYTGAILVCGDSHIGVMKKKENYFAWWTITGTKTLRIITSIDVKEFLRLIVKEIDRREEDLFVMRVITISYAQKLDPDCSDTKGLHEPLVPIASLAEIHRKETEPYDLEGIFRPTFVDTKPIFILGTVGLLNRDVLKEPRVKKCYFVATLAAMVKRDIIQSPIPGMIDKIIEVAEALYREFAEPKFHTEHLLRNVTVMNRIFDLRDFALPLVMLVLNPKTGRNDFYMQVRKHLKKYFKTHSSGILHFTNCCYGFWYSRSTNAYYYLDPYQCNSKGRKVSTGGSACLCIFPSVCQMVKHMCLNQFEDTTGFFIHRLHVDSINVPPFKTFTEDPMWLYLDYHWNFRHAPTTVKPSQNLKAEAEEKPKKQDVQQSWNNYAIEVINLIYSLWGTIGSYDSRFGERAGKNQAAICVAVLAMQYLSHPSRWGPAILDSAVICGDSYYTESLKTSIQKCAKHFNRFNLQTCFKIFPHLWIIDFKEGICGALYGARNRKTLATSLKTAFEVAPNVIIECNRITLAALAAKDGYYVADPCWIGPPLFDKDHGAIYVLRCRNLNSLVYSVIKMLNTNQRLEFHLTPLTFTFEQENFDFVSSKARVSKKILLDTVRTSPGKVEIPVSPIPGAVTVQDEASYLSYRKNLTLGIQKGHELENPQMRHVEPTLEKENMNSMMVSTTWHLNVGQAAPLQKVVPPFDPRTIEHIPEVCEPGIVDSFERRHTPDVSVTDLLAACDDYPRVIDFTSDRFVATRPLECSAARSFLTDNAREEFRAWTTDMRQEIYKTYRHRLPKLKEKSEIEKDEENKRDDFSVIEEEGVREGIDSPDTERMTEITEEGTEVTETEASEGDVTETEADTVDDA